MFPATTRTFTKDTALSELGRGAAWLVWINAGHGRGTAWARHAMCASAYKVSFPRRIADCQLQTPPHQRHLETTSRTSKKRFCTVLYMTLCIQADRVYRHRAMKTLEDRRKEFTVLRSESWKPNWKWPLHRRLGRYRANSTGGYSV